VQADLNESRLSLTIVDNGKGLPVHGRFNERQSAQSRIGPRSLRERVVSLGGSFQIDSTPGGLTLAIDLPLESTNATADHHPDRR
jgi:signal transduction histidine kinase